MLKQFFKRFSGSHYRKYQKKCAPIIERINAFEVEMQSLSEEALKAKTAEFKERFKAGAVSYTHLTLPTIVRV